MKINNTLKLIIAIVVSELAGIIGSVFTTPSIPMWYAGLVKPAFNPPSWVFGPVWTTLFALMGVSAWLVWKKLYSRFRGNDRENGNDKRIKIALGIFISQLVLNTLWSIIFFGLHSPGGAFIEIILLWLAILATIIAFAKISQPAAWLLVPYILWVSFASFLNYSIWQLNKNQEPNQEIVFCTQDAKLCPDGSYVSRTGPMCEFVPCPPPSPEATAGEAGGNDDLWNTITDDTAGITFQHPKRLLTEYISTVNWPPQVQVLNELFACTEAGLETDRVGLTERRSVDDRTYCVTKVTEGAAGSIYTQYTYAFPQEDQTVIFTFTLRSVQCGNYDDPQKTACENERTAFDLDSTVNQIARTLRFGGQ